MKSIKVFSPATVSNVACGFDIMGFAIDSPGDEIIVETNNENNLQIINKTNIELPLEPDKNVTTIALKSMLEKMNSLQGFTVTFTKKIPVGSGIGSSAASAIAGVFGANELLEKPFTRMQLIDFAIEGEFATSGSRHADNVAPAMLGGFTVIRSYEPMHIFSIPYPEQLFCVVVHPQIELTTKEMRKVLPLEVPLKVAIKQWGNVAGLIAGLTTNNLKLISSSLTDFIVEPIRSKFIPGFNNIKNVALFNRALGCSISGSGPSIFAICENEDIAKKVGYAMKEVCNSILLNADLYISKINKEGIKEIKYEYPF